ncbi:MAG: TrkH family potassium uptake protein [Euryarchaeota archaeon]|nr:TrkH family potassium uptake protein [Euryarchaeota archaeon]
MKPTADAWAVLRDLGSILVILAVVMVGTLPVALHYGELTPTYMWAFLYPAGLLSAAGVSLQLVLRRAPDTELRHALVVAALAYLLLPIFSALPLYLYGVLGPLDSLFETMSGWTTTGLTLIPDPRAIPHVLVFWRSLIQWVGGVGVVILTMIILGGRPGTSTYALYKSEGREEKIQPTVVSTVRTTSWIYVLFTLLAVLLLAVVGMDLWDSVNHAMTTLSTAGFSTQPQSIATYNSLRIEAALVPFMLLGALPFLVLYRALRGRFRALLQDVQFQALVLLVTLGALALTLENYLYYGSFLTSLRHSAFQFVSALSTTGHQTVDILAWPTTSKIILSFAMIVGGAAGSTAGGIKLVRAVAAYRGTRWWFRKASLPPSAIATFKLGDRNIPEEDANRLVAEANLITILWLVFLLAGVITLLHLVDTTRFGLAEAIFEVASAQGNAGLTIGITSPDLHPLAKLTLMMNMWVGRLEIIPALLLFRGFVKGLRPF